MCIGGDSYSQMAIKDLVTKTNSLSMKTEEGYCWGRIYGNLDREVDDVQRSILICFSFLKKVNWCNEKLTYRIDIASPRKLDALKFSGCENKNSYKLRSKD